MFDNQYINTLIGGIMSLFLAFLGRLLITTRERTKLETDQLKTNSEILQNHSETISNLQQIVSKITLENETMREKLAAILAENQIMESKLDIMTKRISDLESENTSLKAELLKHTNQSK